MSTCRQCRWSKVDMGDPFMGICIAGRYEASEKETTSGIAQSVIPGKRISLSDKICDKFENKPSFAERIREGM